MTTATSIFCPDFFSSAGAEDYLASRGFVCDESLFGSDEERENALCDALGFTPEDLEEETDIGLYRNSEGLWALVVGAELAVEFRAATAIDLSGYEPDALDRTEDAGQWPTSLALGANGAGCEAAYEAQDGSADGPVLYSTLVECMNAHQMDAGHLAAWLDGQGRSLDASLVETLANAPRTK